MENKNQGEGNVEAARHYNDAQKNFVDSGKVDAAAQAAEPGSDAEASDLKKAEDIGKSHAKGEDPTVAGANSDHPGKT